MLSSGASAGCLGRNRRGGIASASPRSHCHVAKDETEKVRLAEPIANRRNLNFRARAEFAFERGPHRAHTAVTFDKVHDNPNARPGRDSQRLMFCPMTALSTPA